MIALFLGIILGITLTFLALFYLIKVKYPGCKRLKPLQEIIIFSWKTCTISGKICQRCQRPRRQADIAL